jgi:hypothetical protein
MSLAIFSRRMPIYNITRGTYSRADGGGDNVANVFEVSRDLLLVTLNLLFNEANNEVAAYVASSK